MLRQTYLLPENSLGQSIETREFQWRLTYPEIKEGDAPLSFVKVLEASLCSEQVFAHNKTHLGPSVLCRFTRLKLTLFVR